MARIRVATVRSPAQPRARVASRIDAHERSESWLDTYVRSVLWTDTAVVIVVVLAAQVLRFGPESFGAPVGRDHTPVWVVSLAVAIAWLAALRIGQCVDRRIVAAGPTEYSRLVTASFGVFGAIAILDLLLKLDMARSFLAIALPAGTIGLLVSHWVWRARLARRRHRRLDLNRVIVIGGLASAQPLIEHLDRNPGLGYDVIGLCVPPEQAAIIGPVAVNGRAIPIVGEFADAREAVSISGATTVAVTSAEALGHSAMRELSWDLEGMDVDMVVAPGVVDVAGPRMRVRPVAGLPLLHVDKPSYDGANRIFKTALDRVGATILLLFGLPVMVACAIAIKLDSPGPIFYRAERIGINNQPFTMWKFRSMVTDAENMKVSLIALNEGAGALFKIRDDPRVTRVGKIIRRYSLDELPQLINVLTGTMSMVGPRPPLASEVERYDGLVVRRMLVRPGMTGLWQVSGRSDLSWDESVRLDLTYVENWSIMSDAMILWRTFRAVLGRSGAY